jgi:hypothetical protein
MTKLVGGLLLVLALFGSKSVFCQVYKCVDPATGKTTFTDTACPDKGTGNYVPTQPANSDSAYSSEEKKNPDSRASEKQREQKHLNRSKWINRADKPAK